MNKTLSVGILLYALCVLGLGIFIGNMAAAVCFGLAAYAVVGNDAVQTLMTYIHSNQDIPWKWLWLGGSVVLLFALWYGYLGQGGDITYGRLDAKGYADVEVSWVYVIFPLILIFLTRKGIPVSTSLLMLSIFSGEMLFGQIVTKSIIGYLVAFSVAYLLWVLAEYYLSQRTSKTPSTEPQAAPLHWRFIQGGTTALLFWTWLTHDMVNIAVFLPSNISIDVLTVVSIIFVLGLAYTFYSHGGKVGQVVTQKTNTDHIKVATAIDLIYFLILLVFKEWSHIPMSTTWVFLGLLAGRQLAIRSINFSDSVKNPLKTAGKEIWKDFGKLMLGLGISVLTLVLARNFL